MNIMDKSTSLPIYVYNFPSNFESSDLSGIFKTYGNIKDIKLISTCFPEDTSKALFEKSGVEYVYAIISYDSEACTAEAVKSLHNQIIYEGQTKPLIVAEVTLSGSQLMYVAPKTVPNRSNGNKFMDMISSELHKVNDLETQLPSQICANQYFLAINNIKNMLIEIQNYLFTLPQYISQAVSTSMSQYGYQYQHQHQQKFANPVPQLTKPQHSSPVGQFMTKPAQFNGGGIPQMPQVQQVQQMQQMQYYNPVTNIVNDNQSFHSGISSVSSSPSLSGISSASSNARGPPGANIFVYHLPSSVDNEELVKMFSPFGPILSTRVYKDPSTGESKGFGFVSYASPESAKLAIGQMNGYHIENKRLKVELKKE